MSDKVLFETEWLQLKERDGWYHYIHSIAGNGEGVMVLVHDFLSGPYPKLLARFEHNPVHLEGSRSPKQSHLELTSITGMCDKKGKDMYQIAVEELKEEAGISATVDELEYLDFVYPSKASDTKLHLFAFDAHNVPLQDNPEGDGTKGEEDAYVEWMSADELVERSNCPLVATAWMRLLYNKKGHQPV